MKMNRKLISSIILTALIIFLLWTVNYKKNETKIINNSTQGSGRELSMEEYLSIKDKYVSILEKENPKVALNALREETKTNSSLLRSCHSLVHELGHEAYEKYKDFGEAMKYQDEICNSGYLHGIIESYFSKSEDLFSSMNSVCSNYKAGSFVSWECFHGVGHGLMYYTNDDLPRSLTLCSEYKDEFASSNCKNGVFMENFNSDQKLHVSKFLKDDDLFYPCDEQSNSDKYLCYLYAPTRFLTLYKNEYGQALEWCQTAKKDFRMACANGVGSQSIKENINDPKFVETICMNGEASQREPCIFGMVALYINHYGSPEPAKILCEKMEEKNKDVCYRAVRQSNSLFIL